MERASMRRRDFLKAAGLAGAAGIAAGCARPYRHTNARLPRNEGKDGYFMKAADLKEGVSTLVYSQSGPVLLVKWRGEIKAYQSVCPHTMCELNDGEGEQPMVNGEVRCWIHDSFFQPGDGGYISGPANPNGKLPEFKILIRDGKIYRG
jgi:nitrite reductase/ring-hydroxylating ferredoxin subunit